MNFSLHRKPKIHRIMLIFTLALCALLIPVQLYADVQPPKSFYQLSATNIDGKVVSFSDYQGKVVLIVNTASRCGFTEQYRDLQKLYDTFKERGLVILGFPTNDFGNQEPESNSQIKEFCRFRYGVSFPLFEKKSVKGDERQEVFSFLTRQCPKAMRGEVKWNFEKFLLDRYGAVRGRYGSFTNPMSSRLVSEIEALLAEPGPGESAP